MNGVERLIAQRRLASQRLAGAALASVTEVVHWLGAVQAQVYPIARWSIGLRADGLHAASVDDALARAEVIRTHVLRDTWHLVSAQDIQWLLDLTAPRVQQRNQTMYRKLGLAPPLLARTDAVLSDALTGGKQLTRTELAAELARRGIPADGVRLTYILMHAELTQHVCSGARRGNQHTYALLQERVPRTQTRSRDEALGMLIHRYLRSHGPATVKDFSVWSSLTIADTKRGLEIARGELEHTTAGGRRYWFTTATPATAPAGGAFRAHLLQAYDEYTVAYRDSREAVDPARLTAVIPGRTTRYTHNILLDGQIIGHWRHANLNPQRIEVQLARTLDREEDQAVGDAIHRYRAFLVGGCQRGW